MRTMVHVKQASRRRWLAVATGCLLPLSALSAGCEVDDSELQMFRDAAADGVKTGLASIFGGFLEGTFAVVTKEGDTEDDTTDSEGDASSS